MVPEEAAVPLTARPWMEKAPLMGTETCFQPVKSSVVRGLRRLEVVPSLYRKERVLPEPSPWTQTFRLECWVPMAVVAAARHWAA